MLFMYFTYAQHLNLLSERSAFLSRTSNIQMMQITVLQRFIYIRNSTLANNIHPIRCTFIEKQTISFMICVSYLNEEKNELYLWFVCSILGTVHDGLFLIQMLTASATVR